MLILTDKKGSVYARIYPGELYGKVIYFISGGSTGTESHRTIEGCKRYAKQWISYPLGARWKRERCICGGMGGRPSCPIHRKT